jgi:hypothetical protein
MSRMPPKPPNAKRVCVTRRLIFCLLLYPFWNGRAHPQPGEDRTGAELAVEKESQIEPPSHTTKQQRCNGQSADCWNSLTMDDPCRRVHKYVTAS